MAIRTIILRKKITDQKKILDDLMKKRSGFDQIRAELEKREAEIVASVDEASTDEERSAVEEAADQYDSDKKAFDDDVQATENQISDIETEVAEMERELTEIEDAQNRTVPPPPENADDESDKTTKTTKKKSGGKRTMFKTRAIRQMTIVEREEMVNRDDVKAFLTEVRTAVAEKRALTGGQYLIPRVIIDVIREDMIEYSKLYKHCRVVSLSGDGRVIVMGKSAEAFWEECCDPIYELEKALTKVDIDCYKVAGFIPLCNAMIEDSDIDLLDEISVSILQGIGLALDKAIIYGTGVKMPTGVVTAIDADDALKLTNEITIPTASSTGKDLFKALIKATKTITNIYARGPKTWVLNDNTYIDIQAEGIDFNAAGVLVSAVNGTMPVAGGDLEVLNFIPDDNLVVGFFELYVLGERKEMTIDTSEHVRFLQDQTVIRGRARYDGKPAVTKAFAVIGINNTSPTTSVDFANPSEG